MQVSITTRHGTVAQTVQDYMRQKSEKLTTLFERLTAITVTVSFENHRCTVELLVDAEHKHDFVASEIGDDVTATFNLALHKMEHQLHKYKEKIQNHRGSPTAADVAGDGLAT